MKTVKKTIVWFSSIFHLCFFWSQRWFKRIAPCLDCTLPGLLLPVRYGEASKRNQLPKGQRKNNRGPILILGSNQPRQKWSMLTRTFKKRRLMKQVWRNQWKKQTRSIFLPERDRNQGWRCEAKEQWTNGKGWRGQKWCCCWPWRRSERESGTSMNGHELEKQTEQARAKRKEVGKNRKAKQWNIKERTAKGGLQRARSQRQVAKRCLRWRAWKGKPQRRIRKWLQTMWRKSCIQSWPHDFFSFSFSWMSHSFPNHVEIDWFSLSILSNTEAYSTGWKLAKKLFPDQAEKWSSEGVKVRLEKLEELRAKGIQAAKYFKCARHFALQHVVFCVLSCDHHHHHQRHFANLVPVWSKPDSH